MFEASRSRPFTSVSACWRPSRHTRTGLHAAEADRQSRTSERSIHHRARTFDGYARQLLSRPVSRDFAQLHPRHIVEPRVQAAHHFLERAESGFGPVVMNARPMRHHARRLTAPDHVHHAPLRPICRNEEVRPRCLCRVPIPGPVAGAADDGHDAPRIRGSQPRRVLDARRDARRSFADRVQEVVRNLRAVNMPARFERSLRELRPSIVAEPSGRGDTFAGQFDVVQNLERIGHVGGDLVRGLPARPLPVLHVVERARGIWVPRAQVDHSRVSHHLGMDAPVASHQIANESNARADLFGRPAGYLAVQASDTRRIGNDTVLPFHPVRAAPLAELAHEIIRNLDGHLAPVLRVVLASAPRRSKLRNREVIQVHQAGGIVDNERDWHAASRVENFRARVA